VETLTLEELEVLATASAVLPTDPQSQGCDVDGCFGDKSSCGEKSCRPND
jgi:hypothetical protein